MELSTFLDEVNIWVLFPRNEETWHPWPREDVYHIPPLKALKTPLLASLQGFAIIFTFAMSPLRLVKGLRWVEVWEMGKRTWKTGGSRTYAGHILPAGQLHLGGAKRSLTGQAKPLSPAMQFCMQINTPHKSKKGKI